MANVLNRTTKEYRVSANTPDFPVADWIINPDVSAVAGFATQYWIITGDVVTLMTPAERDAVDAANLAAGRDEVSDQLDELEDVLRAFALTVLDEFNVLRVNEHGLAPRTIAQLKNAVRNKLGT